MAKKNNNSMFTNDGTASLCEGHALSFDCPNSIRVPALHELTDDEEPVPCDACSYGIMRRAGVL